MMGSSMFASVRGTLRLRIVVCFVSVATDLRANTFSLEGLCLVLESEVVWLAIDTSLVNDGDSLEGYEEVLVLPRDAGSISSAEVVEVRDLLEDEVDEGEYDCHTQRVGPDSDDGDDVGPVLVVLTIVEDIGRTVTTTNQPAEEGEHGGEDIDNQDSTDELERRPCPSTLYSGDEDEPVFGQSYFQEENTLWVTKVLNDTAVVQEEGASENPCTAGQQDAQDDGDDPDLW